MRLIALGHVVLDHLLLVERHPAVDSKSLALRGRECTGGPAARAALTAAALGVDTWFAGCVGDDAAGLRILADMKDHGVCADALAVQPGCRTPRASIWVEARGGKRTVVLDRGDVPPLDACALDDLPWGKGILLLDGKEPVAQAAANRARAAGMDVMLDLGGPRENPLPLIQAADVAVVSKAFVMATFPGKDLLAAAVLIAGMGPRLAVITVGAGGVIACERTAEMVGEPFWFPAWNPGVVVDTTGAGDAYHGALAWALIMGLETKRALAVAAVTGGMACRDLGGEIQDLSAQYLLEKSAEIPAIF